MNPDNESHSQSQYGSLGRTTSRHAGQRADEQNEPGKMAPKPALRQKTLEKRLSDNQKSGNASDPSVDSSLAVANDAGTSPLPDRSMIHDHEHRPQLAPLSLSMSQVRQQQAINRELAERRRKSVKRSQSAAADTNSDHNTDSSALDQDETKEPKTLLKYQSSKSVNGTNAGFHNAAFDPSDSPIIDSATNNNKSNINHLPNDFKIGIDTEKHADERASDVGQKNIDQNPLSLLIKRDDAQFGATTTTNGSDTFTNDELAREQVDDDDQRELSDIDETQLRPYPKKVFFIVANEFCERFSYYGLRTVLVLYFKTVLGMSNSQSTVNFHIFAALCYLTPILGATLGDSVWGKYKTILYLSMVYFIGELILVCSSIIWQSSVLSHWLTLIGLILIGFGTGGIKPCVSAFGGDQFLPNETKRRASFFSIFYAAINAGSLLSMFVTPMLRSDVQCVGRLDCYPLAFGLPCILMLISIISFLLAKDQYTRKDLPEKNIILAFSRCVFLALRRKITGAGEAKYYKRRTSSTPSSIASSLNQEATADDKISGSALISPDVVTLATGNESKQARLEINNNIGSGHKSDYDNNSSINASLYKLDKLTSSFNDDKGNKSNSIASSGSASEKTKTGTSIRSRSKRNHWIYLASDQFDAKSLEDFRAVLGILLLFVPIPVYWCLFDQQGSLWTLQAAQMEGRIPGTQLFIQPDQVSVANPVLLLAAIPLFECFIYPTFKKYKLFTSAISKITLGGFIAALTFAVSAGIEFQIQAATPPLAPTTNEASLNLVNGLADCRLIELELTHVHTLTDSSPSTSRSPTALSSTDVANASRLDGYDASSRSARLMDSGVANDFRFEKPSESVPALGSQLIKVRSRADTSLNNYRIRFRVASPERVDNYTATNNNNINISSADSFRSRGAGQRQQAAPIAPARITCALDPALRHELIVAPLDGQAKQLLYIEQGNGKLKYHLFNESWQLPEANKARVVLVYESFGPLSDSAKRKFSLLPPGRSDRKSQVNEVGGVENHNDILVNVGADGERDNSKYQFTNPDLVRFGSVYMYQPVDFEVPTRGLKFSLQTMTNSTATLDGANNNVRISTGSGNGNEFSKFNLINLDDDNELSGDESDKTWFRDHGLLNQMIYLKPGTRNLIVVHQANSNLAYFKHSLIQDNNYRINILWQLIPYLMISMSEILFSITGLEFSYSIAPETMKSVILGAWFLTTAVGNILTVAVEAIHPFSNVAYDFLFYAALMAADMLLFMYIGLNFKPYMNKSLKSHNNP